MPGTTGPSNVTRMATKQPAVAPLRTKDFLSVLDLDPVEIVRVLDLAAEMKRLRRAGRTAAPALAGRHVALLFEKPSLRTRATFVIAVRELGGEVLEPPPDVALGDREAVEDVARNLERWVSGAVVRTFAQHRLVRFAAAAPSLHVVNALTNEQHPCQALADLLTLRETAGSLAGRAIAFVGDGNNVAASLAHAGAMLGVHVRVSSPDGFTLPAHVVTEAAAAAREGGTVDLVTDPFEAVRGADVVYTDAWTSMGQEADAAAREDAFRPYQVNATLMRAAGPNAHFMHCLPAHRGAEVTDDVIDAIQSVVFEQAENRLHTQKALLALLMGR